MPGSPLSLRVPSLCLHDIIVCMHGMHTRTLKITYVTVKCQLRRKLWTHSLSVSRDYGLCQRQRRVIMLARTCWHRALLPTQVASGLCSWLLPQWLCSCDHVTVTLAAWQVQTHDCKVEWASCWVRTECMFEGFVRTDNSLWHWVTSSLPRGMRTKAPWKKKNPRQKLPWVFLFVFLFLSALMINANYTVHSFWN